MINKDKIVFNSNNYYTPTFTSPVRGSIVKLLENNCVLVKTKKGNTFVRPIQYVYNTEEDAKRGGRDWEHADRKRRREKKKQRKESK